MHLLLVTLVLVALAQMIYPPVCAALFLLGCVYEAPGIATIFPQLQIIFFPLLLGATIKSFLKLSQHHNEGITERYSYYISCLALVSIIWIFISRLFNTMVDFDLFLSPLIISGFCILIITIAYFRDIVAQKILVGVVGFHLIVALLLMIIPAGPWRIFHYSGGITTSTSNSNDLDLPDLFNVNNIGQFGNPIHLSLYAAISIIILLYFLRRNNNYIMLMFGIIGICVTSAIIVANATRSIIIAFILGSLFMLLRPKKFWHYATLSLALFLTAFIMFNWFISADVPQFLVRVQSRMQSLKVLEDVGTTYRFEALRRCWDHFADRPLFGYGNYENANDALHYLPHQLPLFYLMINGIPLFISISILILFAIIAAFSQASNRDPISKHFFSKLQYSSPIACLIYILLVLTNGTNIPSLNFILLAIILVPNFDVLHEYALRLSYLPITNKFVTGKR